MLDKLYEKKQRYVEMKLIVQHDDNFEEIEKKVEEFRQKLISENEATKAEKLLKIDTYLELLDELITEEECKTEEPNDEQKENKEEEL